MTWRPPRPRAKTKDKEEKKVSRKAKPQDLDSDGSDLQLERPKKEAKSEKDQKVPPKAQKKDDSDSDVPRRPAPGGFDRLEPSRSRDPKGKGDGFGFGKGDGFGKGTGKGKGKGKEENDQPKEQPNFEPSGLLALEDNAKNGIPLKFTVPAEARRPATKWRLYVFSKQNGEKPKMIHIYKNVGYLFGKDRRIVDVPTDHPTCSKQHAVLHYRQTSTGLVKPYIMDLESVNGTFVNGSRIDAARYVELREKDVLKFGMSSREFVLLHGGSANHVAIDAKDLKSDSE
ncbi:unnamed protein product [Durusdinium trenchii]|uniref:FHA domain-containing protein n=1 Tax=Durusdinium trenchii TaxID=1381693 RepID=A0ABP0LTK4_9DINO